MIRIQVNGRFVEAEEGESILSAVARAGIRIPTLCRIEGLIPEGTCRICVVELLNDSIPSAGAEAGETGCELSGDEAGMETLVPACSHPVREGMRILTHSDKVIESRRTLIELLLADHPDDCLYCGKSRSCRLKALAEEYGIRERSFPGSGKKNVLPDTGSSALVRDGAKCILCGKCVRICGERQGIAAMDFTGRGGSMAVEPAFHQDMVHSPCIACGQCLGVCPTGALREQDSLPRVLSALNSDSFYPVVQCDPASMAALAGDLFPRETAAGIPGSAAAGPVSEDSASLIRGALACIGFKRVYDSSWGFGMSLIRTAGEWISRFREEETNRENGGEVSHPLISACPALWRKYVREECPELSPLFSKVPDGWESLGRFLKTQFSSGKAGSGSGDERKKLFIVGILPCVAKKASAGGVEGDDSGGERTSGSALDAVLTTRECAQLFRLYGIDFSCVPRRGFDSPFPEDSSFPPLRREGDVAAGGGRRNASGTLSEGGAGEEGSAVGGCGLLFSRSGGMTGGLLTLLSVLPEHWGGRKGRGIRGLRSLRSESMEGFPGRVFRLKGESSAGREITCGVLNGAGESVRFLKDLSSGKTGKNGALHFVELTACPGGCIGGGGQIPELMPGKTSVPERMEAFAGLETFLSDLCVKLRFSDFFEKENLPIELFSGKDVQTEKPEKKTKAKESRR